MKVMLYGISLSVMRQIRSHSTSCSDVVKTMQVLHMLNRDQTPHHTTREIGAQLHHHCKICGLFGRWCSSPRSAKLCLDTPGIWVQMWGAASSSTPVLHQIECALHVCAGMSDGWPAQRQVRVGLQLAEQRGNASPRI